MNSKLRCLLHVLTSCCLGDCALLSKGEALSPRYFSTDSAHTSTPDAVIAKESRLGAGELRLGRVSAAAYLGERIVFRNSNYELDFYETRRWTESPDVYLRRALEQSLFEKHGLRRIISGVGPTLEVELSEFAELKVVPAAARVRATYLLHDNRLVRREATVTVELPIGGDSSGRDAPERAVRVMADALNRAVEQIVDEVIAELGPRAPVSEVRTPEARRQP